MTNIACQSACKKPKARSYDLRERLNLSPVETLQETESHRVELVRNSGGQRLVLKTYKVPSRMIDIELAVLRSLSNGQFEFLRIPELVAASDKCLVTSYVERSHYTRDTILHHAWTREDVTLFCSALREFQGQTVDQRLFTTKQRMMGVIYPVIRLALTLPAAFRTGGLGLANMPQLALMVVWYLIARLTFRNVLTHYDLTTLNYTFAPDHRMSMLDFEFAYSSGDPMFDAIYYVTIPPIVMSDWTFQNEIVARQVCEAGGGLLAWNRARLILTVCLLSRYLFFANDRLQQSIVRDNVRNILSRSRFSAWKQRMTG